MPNANAARSMFGCALIGIAGWNVAARATAAPLLDFPLAPGTRWTYHLRQELGEGVNFGPDDAKLAKGNVLDTTVVSQVAGSEKIGTQPYIRLDATKSGKVWLSEWYRLDEQGLFVGRRVEEGQETTLDPPQKVLSAILKPGEKWSWKASGAPVTVRTSVGAEESVTVPAGAFRAIKVSAETLIKDQVLIKVQQDRWFAVGVGFVKQDTRTTIGPRMISHVVLTLEKFEGAR